MTKQFFEQIQLETTQAKGGYGVGLQIGQQLVDSGLGVEPEAVAKGIYDMLNGNKPAIDFNEVTSALQTLQQQAQQAQQAQFKAIAEAGEAYLADNAQKDGGNGDG